MAQSGRAQRRRRAQLRLAAALAGVRRGSGYGDIKGSEAQGMAKVGRGK